MATMATTSTTTRPSNKKSLSKDNKENQYILVPKTTQNCPYSVYNVPESIFMHVFRTTLTRREM